MSAEESHVRDFARAVGLNRALISAVRAGEPSAVARALNAGADPDAEDGAALIHAAANGLDGIVALLTAAGADVHARDGAALRFSCALGKHTAAGYLLAAGADPFAGGGRLHRIAREEGRNILLGHRLSRLMHKAREDFMRDLGEHDDPCAFLRAPWRGTGEPALVRALRMDMARPLAEALICRRARLEPDDLFILSGRTGQPAALVALRTGQMEPLLDPALWHGNGAFLLRERLRELWPREAPAEDAGDLTQRRQKALRRMARPLPFSKNIS